MVAWSGCHKVGECPIGCSHSRLAVCSLWVGGANLCGLSKPVLTRVELVGWAPVGPHKHTLEHGFVYYAAQLIVWGLVGPWRNVTHDHIHDLDLGVEHG